MEVEKKQLYEVYKTYNLNIPDFQRDIEWDKEMISKFLLNLKKAYDKKEKQNFIGITFFKESEKSTKHWTCDGQQRLTTISGLVFVLSKLLSDNSERKDIDEFLKEAGILGRDLNGEGKENSWQISYEYRKRNREFNDCFSNYSYLDSKQHNALEEMMITITKWVKENMSKTLLQDFLNFLNEDLLFSCTILASRKEGANYYEQINSATNITASFIGAKKVHLLNNCESFEKDEVHSLIDRIEENCHKPRVVKIARRRKMDKIPDAAENRKIVQYCFELTSLAEDCDYAKQWISKTKTGRRKPLEEVFDRRKDQPIEYLKDCILMQDILNDEVYSFYEKHFSYGNGFDLDRYSIEAYAVMLFLHKKKRIFIEDIERSKSQLIFLSYLYLIYPHYAFDVLRDQITTATFEDDANFSNIPLLLDDAIKLSDVNCFIQDNEYDDKGKRGNKVLRFGLSLYESIIQGDRSMGRNNWLENFKIEQTFEHIVNQRDAIEKGHKIGNGLVLTRRKNSEGVRVETDQGIQDKILHYQNSYGKHYASVYEFCNDYKGNDFGDDQIQHRTERIAQLITESFGKMFNFVPESINTNPITIAQ
jgi:uncharacterized protein with ParB-like and HNH nuclease domain